MVLGPLARTFQRRVGCLLVLVVGLFLLSVLSGLDHTTGPADIGQRPLGLISDSDRERTGVARTQGTAQNVAPALVQGAPTPHQTHIHALGAGPPSFTGFRPPQAPPEAEPAAGGKNIGVSARRRRRRSQNPPQAEIFKFLVLCFFW